MAAARRGWGAWEGRGRLAGLILWVVAGWAALVWAPADEAMGPVQRLLYWHVAVAWVALLGWLVIAVAAAGVWLRRWEEWPDWAVAATEIGTGYITLTVVTGVVWARAVWGVWWTWEPRLTSTLVLFALYGTMAVLGTAIPEPREQARARAGFGLLGAAFLPLVVFSVYWWRSLHPPLLFAETGALSGRMRWALGLQFLAWLWLAVELGGLRLRLYRLEVRRGRVRDHWGWRG
ncbi:MAG: cytochrome c biogenesis protein CcsA [Limnochordaceae bacterium]|nr:cytochrome c biogenesis protein CcsA [Limnochordaceae bacterium]